MPVVVVGAAFDVAFGDVVVVGAFAVVVVGQLVGRRWRPRLL